MSYKQKAEQQKAIEDAKTVAKLAPDTKTKKEAEKVISIAEPKVKVNTTSLVDKALNQGVTCSLCGGNLQQNGVKGLTESDKKFNDKPAFILECRKPHTTHDKVSKLVQESSTPSGIIEILAKDL